jgi:hypothetical protein
MNQINPARQYPLKKNARDGTDFNNIGRVLNCQIFHGVIYINKINKYTNGDQKRNNPDNKTRNR